MSKELAFRAIYPALKEVRTEANNLIAYLDDATSTVRGKDLRALVQELGTGHDHIIFAELTRAFRNIKDAVNTLA